LRRRRLLDDEDEDDDEDVSDEDDDEDVSDDDEEESSRRRFVAIFVGLLSFSFCNCETSLDSFQKSDDWKRKRESGCVVRRRVQTTT
tara:strand:+ start:822 stop:1082 length:261 start_codon:yes stop_codon:yes gene_type:complete